MTLDTLPSELLLHIATYFDTLEFDAVLTLVIRRLLDVFRPRLYHAAISVDLPDITVGAAAEGNLETLKVAATYGAQFQGKYPLSPMGCVADDWRLEHYRIHQMEGDTLIRWGPNAVVPDDYDAGLIPQEACWATPLAMAAMQTSIARLLFASGASYHNVRMPNRFHKYPLFSMVGSPNNVNSDGVVNSYHEMKRRIFGLDEGNGLLDQGDFSPQEEDGDRDASISPSIPLLQTIDGIPELAETEDLVVMVSYIDPYSVPALHIAASSGAKAIMTYLVKNVCVDILSQDSHGGTVLYYAALAPQHSNALNKALSLGADPRVEFSCTMDMFGQQSFDALDWAVHFRVEQAVDALLPLKESRIKHMFRALHTGSFPRHMTPEWRYRAQCFEMFSSRLLSATVKQDTVKSHKKYLPFHRVFEMAFFWALQTDSLEREEFSWIDFDRFDLNKMVSVQSYDENLVNQWTLSWNVAPNPTTDTFCSIGTIALYSVVAGKANSGLQVKRIRWLLNAGAKPCPPGRETEMFSPIRHLLHSMRLLLYQTNNDFESYMESENRLFDSIVVIDVLAAAGGWNAFTTDVTGNSEGLLAMAAHYSGMRGRVAAVDKELSKNIHSMLEETMPSKLVAILEAVDA
ncbi:hypothetical protein CH35J_009145 [Colletotrichum higginsianum]|uniref:F-box domain-containing protein n=1 Tax=Colletotrichum higginsianum TaxID=80884 RepID=A0A4T0VNH6_9PEZI|nr:hypothetical protein CH35J_009145 [Colletotrichum higginsianum]